MEKEFRSGYVSIIGRPNVGKSTLLNYLIGQKIAITTKKAGTTRTKIIGIITDEESQIIFVDTPGINKGKDKLTDKMMQISFEAIKDAELIVFMIDPTKMGNNIENFSVLDKIKEAGKNAILVISKSDLVKKDIILELIALYKDKYNFLEIIPISVIKEQNITELLKAIKEHLPLGPQYYSEEEYTNQTERQMVEEVIREKALKLLNEEVPHGIVIEVEKMKLKKNKDGEPIYHIEANIFCLKKSHKGIIIGKDGSMLKRIGQYAREDLEKELDIKINLKLWVKVKDDWKDNEIFVNHLYKDI